MHKLCSITLESNGARWIDDRKGVPGFAQFSFDEHFNPEFDLDSKIVNYFKINQYIHELSYLVYYTLYKIRWNFFLKNIMNFESFEVRVTNSMKSSTIMCLRNPASPSYIPFYLLLLIVLRALSINMLVVYSCVKKWLLYPSPRAYFTTLIYIVLTSSNFSGI